MNFKHLTVFTIRRKVCFVFIFMLWSQGSTILGANLDSLRLKIKGQWFLGYQYGEEPDNTVNQFTLKRGYITFSQRLNQNLSVRFTQDITLDKEGEDAGNIELRIKYCYLKWTMDDIAFLTKPTFEFGLVHRPWLDFEEHINRYRVQGTMFLERNKIINSADFGVTLVTLLGGEMGDTYKKNVSHSYPGKYGSIVLGLYNGAGYHAIENNGNKTLEGRLTLRPFPDIVPGLQFSYNGVVGKANDDYSSDFTINNLFISSESKVHTLTAQYYFGKGDFSGTYADTNGYAAHNKGYSLFGEIKTFKNKLCFFSRYDYFKSTPKISADVYEKQSYVFGISSYFYKRNKVVFDVDFCDYTGAEDMTTYYEVAIEILF